MTYIEEIETEIVEMMKTSCNIDEIVAYVSEKVLESYRNGIKAGQKGTQVIRDGKSRRRRIPPQAQ